ncbi:M12 family metallo-peptidase [Portibacter marinus]|uniref:M12 family metallo-peptidase n=1 Tax=Portibacter marinus TaxID=2898660 RepID=UPI001F2E59EF|nr:M12 family metallo-peptidase [Portibacter marinus]
MKYFLLTLMTCCTYLLAYSQNAFVVVENVSMQRSKEFANRTLHYNIDLKQLRTPKIATDRTISLSVPTLDGDKSIILERFQLLSGNYELLTENGKQDSNANQYRFYKGIVKGKEESKVGLTITNETVHLMIHDENGTYEIKRLNGDPKLYAGYYSKEIKNPQFIGCETDTNLDYGVKVERGQQNQRSANLDCVEIYLEVDHKAFTENGSTIESVESWTLELMAQVAVFFHDANTPISVSGVKIYTTSNSDPYLPEGDTAEALNAFRDSMSNQGFNGRLAHLLSGRNLGGGRAYLNVLCSSYYNVGVSGNLNSGGATYSTYTWNINVIAHELGHNFGSQHTHDCAWNGDYTQIDDCGNIWLENNNYTPGFCYDSTNVILPGSNNATIMSYCHVVGGASINLNLGFHQQVRDRIYDRYASTACGGNEACIGVPPANDECADAVRLTPTIACVTKEGDNLYANSSTIGSELSCASNVETKDVWYIVEVPEDGVLTIETKQITDGLDDLVLQIFTGSCGSLTEYDCDDNGGVNNQAMLEISDIALAEQDILVRLVSKTDEEGSFGICAYSENLPCNELADSLISFYETLGGENWTNATGWANGASGSDCNYCNWFGITCDNQEQIVAINLGNNNLNGTPGNQLMNISTLEQLSLNHNSLSGQISDDIISYQSIKQINLDHNNFQGSIPTLMINAAQLESITIASNHLSGPLPEFSYASKISFLSVGNNDFSGCFPNVYTRFLYQGEVDLYGNSMLPYNGDFYARTSDYAGFDFDQDGFCYEIDDCYDNNSSIYDGAPELCDGEDNDCDGQVDEGLNSGPNVWSGPAVGGSWVLDSNWSLGHTPLACEDVEVGMDSATVDIQYVGNVAQVSQNLKSLCLGPNVSMELGSSFNLYIKRGYILNKGSMRMEGYTNFSNPDAQGHAIENEGVLIIDNRAYIYISKSGHNALYNHSSGTLYNNGSIFIDSQNNSEANSAIKNEGTIFNTGSIDIIGMYSGPEIQILDGAEFQSTGQLNVGGSSESEGGNE